jgi:hypothetical protein
MTAHKGQPSPNGNCATGRKLGSLGQSLIVLKSFSPAIVAESQPSTLTYWRPLEIWEASAAVVPSSPAARVPRAATRPHR